MISSTSIYSGIKVFLETNDMKLKAKLVQIQCVQEHIFKEPKGAQHQLNKAHRYIQVYFAFQKVKEEFSKIKEEFSKVGKENFIEDFLTDDMQLAVYSRKQKSNTQKAQRLRESLEERHKVFKTARDQYVKAIAVQGSQEVLRKVYIKEIESLRRTDMIEDKYHLTQAVLDHLEEHWSTKLLNNIENVEETSQKVEETSQKLELWEMEYQQLLQAQATRGIHPVDEDNPDILWDVAQRFYQLFKTVPDEKRRDLLRNSLFPKSTVDSFKSADSLLGLGRHETRPLNYVMFTAHIQALQLIAPYLTKDDWLCRGPYDSTFMHCIIAGLEKGATKNGSPVDCVKLLLKEFPDMARTLNDLQTSPKQYLEVVLGKLQNNLAGTESSPGSGYGQITYRDLEGGYYQESYSQISKTIKACEQILEILKNS